MKDAELGEVLAALSESADLPISLDKTTAALWTERKIDLTLELAHPVPLLDVLDWLFSACEGEIAADVIDGELRVSSPNGLAASVVKQLHPYPELPDPLTHEDIVTAVMDRVNSDAWSVEFAYIDLKEEGFVVDHGPLVQRQVADFLGSLKGLYQQGAHPFQAPAKSAAGVKLDGVQQAWSFANDGAGTSLSEVARNMSELSGLNVLLHPELQKAFKSGEPKLTKDLPEMSMRAALDAICAQTDELSWVRLGELITFCSTGVVRSSIDVAVYDVRKLLGPVDTRESDVEALEILVHVVVQEDSWGQDSNLACYVTKGGWLWMHHNQPAHEQLCKTLNELAADPDPAEAMRIR